MSEEPDEQRARLRASWERQSSGWGRQADRLRRDAMPVSVWMIEHAGLQPGQRVLELAAGPGDTGFMAAELIRPGGRLICSDGAEAMLAVARQRASQLGLDDVEFAQRELEWIDEPTGSLDVVLCRWGVMLAVDPATALGECRRVLKPGGRLVVAVWDDPAANPAMTGPGAALVALGLAQPPAPDGPGPFALSAPGALAELLSGAGFVDPLIEPLELSRTYASVREWIGEALDLSMMFGASWRELGGEQRDAVMREAQERAREYLAEDGSLVLPGRALVAAAEA